MRDKKDGKTKNEKLLTLFGCFFRASSVTFAGGIAMLPAIQRDLVAKRGMLSDDDFIEAVALSQSLPGMVVLNCAVFIGSQCAGLPGAIAAGLGALLPAFGFMLLATIFFAYLPKGAVVQGALRGIRITSAALILYTAFSMGKRILKDAFSVVVMLLSFVAVFVLRFSAFPVLIAALLAGLCYALFNGRTQKSARRNENARDEDAR